jgi:hypothetical protein
MQERSDIQYLTEQLAKAKSDLKFMRRFVKMLTHPEDYGHAVSAEVRKHASFVLSETEWAGH